MYTHRISSQRLPAIPRTIAPQYAHDPRPAGDRPAGARPHRRLGTRHVLPGHSAELERACESPVPTPGGRLVVPARSGMRCAGAAPGRVPRAAGGRHVHGGAGAQQAADDAGHVSAGAPMHE